MRWAIRRHLTAPGWGFQDVLFNQQPLTLSQSLDSYVMENVLFKVSYPAEFHAQTAAEAAVKLHSEVKEGLMTLKRLPLQPMNQPFGLLIKKAH